MTDRLSEAQIASLVRQFYAKARADTVLGPVFEAAVDDWEAHLAHLTRFWSAAMLGTARFSGNPSAPPNPSKLKKSVCAAILIEPRA